MPVMLRNVTLCVLAWSTAAAAQTSAAQTTAAPNDLTGTWTWNSAKSVTVGEPAAKSRSWVYVRAGANYQLTQTTDRGEGPQTRNVQWPVGDGTAATTLPNGLTIHFQMQQHADTTVFLLDGTIDGHSVVTETGRITLSSDGRVLTYVSDLLQGGEITHRAWVFDKTG